MKLAGGYMPRIPGRPDGAVDEVATGSRLCFPLVRAGVQYAPAVADGQAVVAGEPLARAEVAGGTLSMPAPVSGRVSVKTSDGGEPSVVLHPSSDAGTVSPPRALQPERASPADVRQALAAAGVWPFFWSSLARGVPSLDVSVAPRTIIVNCICMEPFRTRGKTILRRSWDHVIQAIRFMPRLLQDYGRTEIILTEPNDPVARKMYDDLAGHAWVRFHPVPKRYPVENPGVLSAALQQVDKDVGPGDDVWVINVQDAAAMGACLAEGRPVTDRVVVVGGPAHPRPRHLNVTVGTPLDKVLGDEVDLSTVQVLRGGLFNGTPVDPAMDCVRYDDDAYFFLPAKAEREFLGFARPGFNRRSILPCFITELTRGDDRAVSSDIRGEHRACIACGQCEKVCPVRLFPQVLHRYLYRGGLDEAEATGLDRCVDCRLCTFVCPSKIELQQQFAEARETLRAEHAEAAEVEDGNAA